MKTPQEIEVLAWERLEEAKLLYEGKKFDGAFYLLGYAVELMLKARTCRLFGLPNMFDETDKDANAIAGVGDVRRALKIHDLRTLLIFSGLKVSFDEMMLVDDDFANIYIGLICKWSEQSRYQTIGTNRECDVKRTIDLLGDKTKGVLQWIQHSTRVNV